MAQLGNSPTQHTILRVEARKSFALGIFIKEAKGRPVDLTGCSLRIVAAKAPIYADSPNILDTDADAIIDVPESGYAQFNLQAGTLDHDPGEYAFSIVLVTSEGYASVLVKGSLEILQNTDYGAVGTDFATATPTQTLDVLLQSNNTISVQVGAQLPPGWGYISDELASTFEGYNPDADAVVPKGGFAGWVLTKTDVSDYSMRWRPVGNGEFALDSQGSPAGHVVMAMGDGTWTWSPGGLLATDIAAGAVPTALGDDEWAWLAPEIIPADWDAEPGAPGEILNKPSLGTAAAEDVEAFVPAETLVTELPGIHLVTELPAEGQDGHLYLVYEE